MSNNIIGWNLASKVMVMAIVISVILLFLAIGALILIHICLVTRTLSRLSNGGGGGGGIIERSSNGSTSMSRDDVEKLPCYDYLAKSSKGSSPIECSVCLDNFKKGDRCRLLPTCSHSFHAQCVDTWLLKNPNCPICRTPAGSRRFDEEISSRFSDIDIELIREEEGMPPTESRRELNDIIRINETQLLGHSQNQTNLIVAHQFGSNPFPSTDSSLENV